MNKRIHLAIMLLMDIMRTHKELNNPNYNQCDKFPCQWCVDAQKIIINNGGQK